jgi:hypothetical protein
MQMSRGVAWRGELRPGSQSWRLVSGQEAVVRAQRPWRSRVLYVGFVSGRAGESAGARPEQLLARSWERLGPARAGAPGRTRALRGLLADIDRARTEFGEYGAIARIPHISGAEEPLAVEVVSEVTEVMAAEVPPKWPPCPP